MPDRKMRVRNVRKHARLRACGLREAAICFYRRKAVRARHSSAPISLEPLCLCQDIARMVEKAAANIEPHTLRVGIEDDRAWQLWQPLIHREVDEVMEEAAVLPILLDPLKEILPKRLDVFIH